MNHPGNIFYAGSNSVIPAATLWKGILKSWRNICEDSAARLNFNPSIPAASTKTRGTALTNESDEAGRSLLATFRDTER